MEPETFVWRSGSFRPNLVTGIFQIHTDLFQVRQRFAQACYVRQVKGHVTKRSRRRLPFVQRNRDVVISNGDTAVKVELLFQTKCALEPFRALLWIPHRQSKVTDDSELKWNFHVRSLQE